MPRTPLNLSVEPWSEINKLTERAQSYISVAIMLGGYVNNSRSLEGHRLAYLLYTRNPSQWQSTPLRVIVTRSVKKKKKNCWSPWDHLFGASQFISLTFHSGRRNYRSLDAIMVLAAPASGHLRVCLNSTVHYNWASGAAGFKRIELRCSPELAPMKRLHLELHMPLTSLGGLATVI